MKEGWTCLKLWEVCEVTDYVANGSFATLKENVTYYNEPNYAILVRVADFSSNFDKSKFVYVDERSYKFLSKSTLYGGEIIMSNVGSVGKCFICPDLGQPMTIGPNSVLVRTPNSRYFYYYFQSESFQKKLKYITNQTTLAKFNKTQFRNLDICIPSPKEQDLIVSRLDAAFAKIDALKANAEKQLSEARKLFQAELTECMKPKEGWEEKKIGEICEIARGGSPRPIKSFITTKKNGLNWIKIGDTDPEGKYIYETKEKIKPEGLKKSRWVEKDEFLLSNSMSFGRPYILKTNGCIHDGWLVLRDYQHCLNIDFFYYLLISPMVQSQFKTKAQGSTVSNLNTDRVSTTLICFPTLSEQQQIVTRLDNLSANIKALEKNLEKTISECDALKQAMLREIFSEE